MHGTNKNSLSDPIEWYTRSQWFIGAAKVLTEKNAEIWDDIHRKNTYNAVLTADAYNTVPWLSFMAIECIFKGLLVANGVVPEKLHRHDIIADYKEVSKFYPQIIKIPDLDYFIREYSDYVFTKKGGNRYPDKIPVPIFSSYWQTAEALRRFAKSLK